MMKPSRVILLVEDNPNDEELTILALKDARVANQVVVVRDGVEALDYLFCKGPVYELRSQDDLPQVVLLDIKLPKIDGLEVLRQLRENVKTKLLPVVLLTSSKEEQDLVKGYSLGANSYIHKPVDFSQFTNVVKQLSLYWLVINEPPPDLERGTK